MSTQQSHFMNAPSILSKSNAVPSEQYYEEVLQKAANYNKRMCHERKMRLPFIDSQTGVAQRHTNLFIPYRYRLPGKQKSQLYHYPSKRWKRKKCCLPFSDLNMSKHRDLETGDSDVHQSSGVEGLSAREALERGEIPEKTVQIAKASQDYRFYYDDWENISEPPDAGEIEHRDSDSSDFEETYTKKRKKRGKGKGSRGGGRAKKDRKETFSAPKPSYDESKTSYDEDNEKPYSCDICGIRYKTKPGLTYHMTHHHSKGMDPMEEPPMPPVIEHVEPEPIHHPIPIINREQELQEFEADQSKPGTPVSTTGVGDRETTPGKYCDFCLGDAIENKKTGMKEDLVSCADCGRSGHPTCLQFTANMIVSVKKYPWQCIECKSCGLCGTSENDDQLLFCDDCDRGFHMYCLKPPLSQPPDGNWSCHLCIEEFYGGKKPDGMD